MLTFYLVLLDFATGIETLGLNTEIKGIQTSEWTHFLLNATAPEGSEGTLRFKLESDPSSEQLVLAESSVDVPLFNTRRTMVHGDNADYNGWRTKRSVHFLTFPISLLSIQGPIYIGVGMPSYKNHSVAFTLTSEYSDGPLCPNDCSGQGNCLHYMCECDDGFIDYDCSVPAVHMKEKKWYSLHVASETTEYVYIKLKEAEILKINFKWHGPFSVVSLTWKGYTLVDLPSETNYYSQTLLPSDRDRKTLVFEEEIMRRDILYIAIINKYHPGENLKVKINIGSDSLDEFDSYFYYLFCIGICVLFLIGIIGIMIVYAFKPDSMDMISARSPAIPENYLNEHFAKTKYQDLQGRFEKMCIICLEQFVPDDEVRQLTCKHVFHARCIEEWFKHNVVCCLCKREYTPHKGLNSTVDI